jgi:FixJ family two-component response regulator
MQSMVAGKPNKLIASELDIGLRTVELRRANVLKKMDADSLADLVRLALLIGEIPPLQP